MIGADLRSATALWSPPVSGAVPVRLNYPAPVVIDAVVADMARHLPDDFRVHGVVCINGVEVPRHLWGRVTTKPATLARPIAITFHYPLRGGGRGGNSTVKSIVGIVAMIGLAIVTSGIATAGWGAALSGGSGFFAAGSVSAKLLAVGVGLAGSLAVSALTSAPVTRASAANQNYNTDNAEAAAAGGNVLDPGGPVVRVIGTRRVYPQLAGQPFVELVDDDEYVSALYVLNGPHALSSIRLGEATIESANDVTYQTREGWDGDTQIDLITRQAVTAQTQTELIGFTVDSETPTRLKHQSVPASDIPVWQGVASAKEPDEIWMHFTAPSGIYATSGSGANVGVPIRIRIRQRGTTTWTNLPELMLSGYRTGVQLRRAVLLRWAAAPESMPAVPSKNGFVAAWKLVPGQSAYLPATSGWAASGYFSAGSGNDAVYRGVEGSTYLRNIALYDNRVEIYLDEATFPRDSYEIEVMRGAAVPLASFSFSAYTLSGTVYDLFGYYLSSDVATILDQTAYATATYLTRVVSIWNEHPMPVPGFACVAIRARNRRVEQVNLLASGYVRDWDGTGWNTWTTTSNPAPHYRDLLVGPMNLDPIEADLVDDAMLVAWRQRCIDQDYTVDAVIEAMRTDDVQNLIASCGYARPAQSADAYSVVMDYDRSSEDPPLVFTARTMSGFRFEKAFPRLPHGTIVSYRDASLNDKQTQIFVYRPGYDGGDEGRFESVTYDGLVDEAKVRSRAFFDLSQAIWRSTFYSFTISAESLRVRKGDLVAVHHDMLIRQAGTARIKARVLDLSGDITGLVLDSLVPVADEPDMLGVADMLDVADMLLVGASTGITIRRADGSIVVLELSGVTAETATVTFAAPVVDTMVTGSVFDGGLVPAVAEGCLVAVGPLGSETIRCVVQDVNPGRDLTAQITCVDEAPELWGGGSLIPASAILYGREAVMLGDDYVVDGT